MGLIIETKQISYSYSIATNIVHICKNTDIVMYEIFNLRNWKHTAHILFKSCWNKKKMKKFEVKYSFQVSVRWNYMRLLNIYCLLQKQFILIVHSSCFLKSDAFMIISHMAWTNELPHLIVTKYVDAKMWMKTWL